MKKASVAELKRCIAELNEVVAKHSYSSARRGLDVTAIAFSLLLDTYALPNAENSEGMCDDPAAFRKIYAALIARESECGARATEMSNDAIQ